MNKHYLIAVLAIIGMGALYKRSLQTMQQGATPSGASIMFVTSDGQQFPVNRDAAMKLELVRLALRQENTMFAPTTTFNLERITAAELAPLISVINDLPSAPNLDNLVIKKLRDLSIDQLSNAFLVANLLDNELAHSIARLFIFKQLQNDQNMSLDKIANSLEIGAAIIEQDYDIVKNSAGFKALNKPIEDQLLNLIDLNITNLYGLLLIQNIETVKTFSLDFNQLVELPVGVLSGPTQLTMISLSGNQLKKLHLGTFNGLTQLQILDLSNNRLEQIPTDLFNGLAQLQWLYLSSNQLTEFPEGMFNGLTQVKHIDLQNNPLGLTAAQIKQQYFPGNNQIQISI